MWLWRREALLQKGPDLLVVGLIEVEVPLTDGGKRLRHSRADDLIGVRRELGARLTSANGNRHDHARRMALAYGLSRRSHRGPCSQPVVDQDDDSVPKIRRRAVLAIGALAPLELQLFFSDNGLDD